MKDVGGGYTRRVAFVVPPGITWSMPIYELALLTAASAYDSKVAPELHVVTPEDAPLAIFGTQATQSLIALLEEAGIHLHAGVYAEQTGQGALELRPTGERIEVDRIVALPRLRAGPGPSGRWAGFLPVDEYARVRGQDDVWAAGDATDFPLKQGGIATQQADVAARAIAARAGAPVQTEAFSPLLRGILLTGTGAWWLRRDPGGGDGEGSSPGTRCGGRRARSPAAGSRRTWPSAMRAARVSRRAGPRSKSAWRTASCSRVRTLPRSTSSTC